MSNVVNFKSKKDHNDDELQTALSQSLLDKGFSSDSVDYAVEKGMSLISMSQELITANFSCTFTASLDDQKVREIEKDPSIAFQKYQAPISEFVLGLIVELTIGYANESERSKSNK